MAHTSWLHPLLILKAVICWPLAPHLLGLWPGLLGPLSTNTCHPLEDGFLQGTSLSITQPPGSGLPHPQGHAPPTYVLGHTTDLSIAPQRPFQEPSDCLSASASPLPSVTITSLSVAQPISTAFPRLPPHPAEQFIIPGNEEYGGRQAGGMGWPRSGSAGLGAGQRAGHKKTLAFRSRVSRSTSQLTGK